MEKAKAIQKEIKKVFGDNPVNLVGGSVRDIVLGREPKDWDYCTPLDPDTIEEMIKASGRKAYGIGKRFGTVGFKVPMPREGSSEDDFMYDSTVPYIYIEVTTYRTEKYTGKSRKPEVAFIQDLDADLARRDFTINAMVLREDGSIYDPFGGRIDILARLIKTVGTPKDRITEDPLRMLRAARFASQLDFNVDPNMIGKMRQLGYTVTNVSKERWVQELDKLLVGKNPVRGLKVLMQSDLAKYVLPEVYLALSEDEGFQAVADTFENNENIDVDSAWAIIFGFIGFPYAYTEDKNGNVKFTNHQIVRRELLDGICSRLKFSNDRRKKLTEDNKIFKTIDL